jgi:hypothetical protein
MTKTKLPKRAAEAQVTALSKALERALTYQWSFGEFEDAEDEKNAHSINAWRDRKKARAALAPSAGPPAMSARPEFKAYTDKQLVQLLKRSIRQIREARKHGNA